MNKKKIVLLGTRVVAGNEDCEGMKGMKLVLLGSTGVAGSEGMKGMKGVLLGIG